MNLNIIEPNYYDYGNNLEFQYRKTTKIMHLD